VIKRLQFSQFFSKNNGLTFLSSFRLQPRLQPREPQTVTQLIALSHQSIWNKEVKRFPDLEMTSDPQGSKHDWILKEETTPR
jgi:hypothetical protein